ncbi:MAG: pyridoxamine 5'-phosphate oxidase [Rhodovulum sulfidophilum]|uniref:Pyridoxamine 5'-phosphate oxidase n=1 Tax=Rhodovulum sulfidophilum TaxID=35806 RepID=A0A2W5N4E7_RHOSU|nr:MAG: pyridoxamine 5'-phosphate oxidase [Rhodovulum sulfidophilum]
MDASLLYHEGNRRLQDRFGSRGIADRLEATTLRRAFSESDARFIEEAEVFFLATADAFGRPDCSCEGGPPGFVRVIGPAELAFPDFGGDGMFKSLGNILTNPAVGMLFLATGPRPAGLRVNGTARVSLDDPLIGVFAGARLVTRVRARAIFPTCPRPLPGPEGASARAPRSGMAPVEPAWTRFDAVGEAGPPRAPATGEGRR